MKPLLLLLTITFGCRALEPAESPSIHKSYTDTLSSIQQVIESNKRLINAIMVGYIISGNSPRVKFGLPFLPFAKHATTPAFEAFNLITSWPITTLLSYSTLLLIDALYAGLPLLDLPYRLLDQEEFSKAYPRLSRALIWGALYFYFQKKSLFSGKIIFLLAPIIGPLHLLIDQLVLGGLWHILNAPTALLSVQLNIAHYISELVASEPVQSLPSDILGIPLPPTNEESTR